jgi:hypothetical protein
MPIFPRNNPGAPGHEHVDQPLDELRYANDPDAAAGDTTPGRVGGPPRHTVHLGGPTAVDGVTWLVNGGQNVNAEVFTFDGPVADAMRAAATRGQAHMNVDPEIMSRGIGGMDSADVAPLGNAAFDQQALKLLRKDLKGNTEAQMALERNPERVLELLRVNQKNRTPDQVAELEAMGIPGKTKAPRLKNHAKVVSADGERAMITTGAFMGDTRFRQEITFEINDPQSVAALDRWMAAGRGTDTAALRQAAADLQQHDIYVNDPVAGSGSYHLTDRIVSMIDDVQPGETIQVTTKNFADGSTEKNVVTKALARAEARGAIVRLVDPTHVSGLSVHGNAIVTPRAAYAGTAHMSSAALSPSKRGRNSREIGVVSSDPATISAIRDWTAQIDANGDQAYAAQTQLTDALRAREAAARRAGDTRLADAIKQQRKEADRLPIKAYSVARDSRADAEYVLSVLDDRRVQRKLGVRRGNAVTELREQLRGLTGDVASAYVYRGWVGQLAQTARAASNDTGGILLPRF